MDSLRNGFSSPEPACQLWKCAMRQLRRLLHVAFRQLAPCCHISSPLTKLPFSNTPYSHLEFSISSHSVCTQRIKWRHVLH